MAQENHASQKASQMGGRYLDSRTTNGHAWAITGCVSNFIRLASFSAVTVQLVPFQRNVVGPCADTRNTTMHVVHGSGRISWLVAANGLPCVAKPRASSWVASQGGVAGREQDSVPLLTSVSRGGCRC